jgi:F-type H+-transporting ATPase subunit b
MLIDWFTVGAQALNFLILVWLMKHFLYKPILHAIDEREKRVAAELANADKKKAEAQKESDEFKHKNEEFDQQRATLLSKATDEVKAERQRLLDEARNTADALSVKRQESLRNDAHNLHQAISRRTQKEVFAITRKALKDLAATSLEERLVEVFIRRLRGMDGKMKAGIVGALKKASDPALVRSAFDLPAEQQAAIQNALNEISSAEIHSRFETAPDLISGIELTTNGQKVAWSIADYLTSLEKAVDELLKEKDKPKANTSSDLTPQIAKRAYELYEQQGRKSDSAKQNWSQAEQEIRNPKVKVELKSDTKAEPKPEAKAEAKPDAQAETKPEAKVDAKPETKVEPKPETKAEPKPEAKIESKPGTKAEPKPEGKVEAKPDAQAETKPEANVESKSETKVEPKPEAKVEPKPEAKVESNSEAKVEPKLDEPKPKTKSQ